MSLMPFWSLANLTRSKIVIRLMKVEFFISLHRSMRLHSLSIRNFKSSVALYIRIIRLRRAESFIVKNAFLR